MVRPGSRTEGTARNGTGKRRDWRGWGLGRTRKGKREKGKGVDGEREKEGRG